MAKIRKNRYFEIMALRDADCETDENISELERHLKRRALQRMAMTIKLKRMGSMDCEGRSPLHG